MSKTELTRTRLMRGPKKLIAQVREAIQCVSPAYSIEKTRQAMLTTFPSRHDKMQGLHESITSAAALSWTNTYEIAQL